MNRRSIIILPILPFWAFAGLFLLFIAAAAEIGLLAVVVGLVELLLVRNGFPPADHPLCFRGPVAALVLVGALVVDFELHARTYSAGRGLVILTAVLAILAWSAIDAYVLPRT